jgi:hypothetical protein
MNIEITTEAQAFIIEKAKGKVTLECVKGGGCGG